MDSEILKQAIVRVECRSGITLGTGFLASPRGYVLTCWHVVEAFDQLLRVRFDGDEHVIPAQLCFDLSDPDADVAVLHLEEAVNRRAAELGSEWQVGDTVWSYGYQYQEHFSSGYPVIGRVTGDIRLREQQLIVVCDTDVQRGLSGAPLLNTRSGKVFALVNAKFDDRGVGFAIPIVSAAQRWSELEAIITTSHARFRDHTALLFQSMGYRVDSSRRPDIARLPSFFADLRLGITQISIVVGCFDREPSRWDEDLEHAVLSLKSVAVQEKRDKAFLVVQGGRVPDPRAGIEAMGVELLSFNELEGRLIDCSDYLRDVVYDFENFHEFADVHRVPVIEQFRWCDLYRYYIDIGCIDPVSGNEYVSAREAFTEFLNDDEQSLLSFLGDYGTGKTTLCLRLTYELAKICLMNPRATRIPLFVPLRDLDPRVGVRGFVQDVLNEYGIRSADATAVDIMMRDGRFVLFVDGFDEVADRLDRRGVLQLFSQISHLAAGRAKVVLTCRTHYFRSEHQSLATLAPKNMTPLMREMHHRRDFRILELSKYDESRLLDLMSRHSANYREQWLRMQTIYNLADLARTPILANIMVNSLEELFAMRSRDEVTSASLYDVYTKFWLDRDDDRSEVTTHERELFAEELAWRMYREDRLSISHEELSEAVSSYFSEGRRRNGEWLDRVDVNIRACSFLARDAHGNYRFAHKSFMEFFVAKKLARYLSQWPHMDLWPRAVQFEVGVFLGQLLGADDLRLIKAYSLDRTNNTFLRGLCMDVQMSVGDTIGDEPIVFQIAVGGEHVAAACADGVVRVFTADLQPFAELDSHRDWVRCVAYSRDGHLMASGGWDGRVLVRSVPSYRVVLELDTGERVNAVRFAGDDDALLCGGYGRDIAIYTLPGGVHRENLTGHTDSIHAIDIDPVSGMVVSAGTDRTVRIWHSVGGDRLEAQEEPIRGMAVSPDGRQIATGSWTGELIVWNTAELRPEWRSTQHTDMINDVAYAPDGAHLVSCSDDKTVKVWSSGVGELLATLPHEDFVMGACYCADGRLLYSGGYEGVVRAWNTRSWTVEHSIALRPVTAP
ncbi:trypsin-like peptidase domain-containing protein [Nocardia sp. NPDC046473]|uniref:trypsin-like peptidase domain-containing protein n=1 Tax=Nocardia sp. NPDC046473 TaxID=3155733 RepID=UPI0033FC7473